MLAYPAIAGTGAELNVLSQEWDFGSIEQGSSKQMVFLIQNTGFANLTIDNIHACCGYSLKSISSCNIAPGARAEIVLACDASRKPLGRDTKYVTILSNSLNNPHMQVPVKADIVPGTVKLHTDKTQNVYTAIEYTAKVEQVPSLTVDEIYEMISTGKDVFVLDVRQKEEYTRKYIANSIRFSKSNIEENKYDFDNILKNIDKRSVIVVHCVIGENSIPVVHMLRESGYNAYNMDGGISEWEAEGYPVYFVKQ